MRRAKETQTEGFQHLRKHLLDTRSVRCPFFEEVVVAFCRAYPVKKMVPSDRLQANCVCTREGFEDCPLFREIMGRLESARAAAERGGSKGAGEAEAPGYEGIQRKNAKGV